MEGIILQAGVARFASLSVGLPYAMVFCRSRPLWPRDEINICKLTCDICRLRQPNSPRGAVAGLGRSLRRRTEDDVEDLGSC